VLVAVVVDSSGSTARSVSARPNRGFGRPVAWCAPVLHGVHHIYERRAWARPRFCRPTAPAKLPASTDRRHRILDYALLGRCDCCSACGGRTRPDDHLSPIAWGQWTFWVSSPLTRPRRIPIGIDRRCAVARTMATSPLGGGCRFRGRLPNVCGPPSTEL